MNYTPEQIAWQIKENQRLATTHVRDWDDTERCHKDSGAMIAALAARMRELQEMCATAGRQLDKAAHTISHMDAFRAKECWEFARQCSAVADSGSQS
jgi:hypothetical protein